MRITSKGQVTIPIDIRERMGLLPDTQVEFKITGNTVLLKKAGSPSKRGHDLIHHMRRKATVRMTTDEILTLTRG
ncbi:MAG: AbrB/MazE/SpoVT family DNA-binding domain-containing protein [Deltaproteobacteria bacterium]